MSELNTTGEIEEETLDPLSPENIGVLHFIQQSRIYDVLMAILTDASPEKARALLEAHASGMLLGPEPRWDGQFVTDNQDATGD